ncbi:MAG: ribbon-helix-helix protein, CopG family [Gammaproteobacteria bacterium]|nr:ribbon-helix-helix protein, CopG family [Gammaproteobacteria bacterium]
MSKQRVNITLSNEALETLKQIAEQRGVSLSEVLRQSIGHEKFLSDEIRAGNRVIIESKDSRDRRELVIAQ